MGYGYGPGGQTSMQKWPQKVAFSPREMAVRRMLRAAGTLRAPAKSQAVALRPTATPGDQGRRPIRDMFR